MRIKQFTESQKKNNGNIDTRNIQTNQQILKQYMLYTT